MSYAVHGSQPSQNWNGALYTPNKRKATVIAYDDNVEVRSIKNPSAQSIKEASNSTSATTASKQGANLNKRSGGSLNSASNQFLIDGTVPAQPSPQLLEKKTETRNGPGRHRSVDLKGLIMELIDETYPPFVCPTCYHTSSARSEADLHFKTNHHGVKAFECVHTKCSQAYSSKPGLRYHLEHAHDVTLIDSTESHHSKHIKQASKSSKPASKNLPTTNHHNNTESATGESNSKRLKKQELSPQLQKKLDETYNITVCPSCKEQFKRKTHVIRHLVEVHHGEEPYKCVVSNCKRTKTYATREGLVYHLVSYHDEMQH